jgi:hypothetical protein
MLQLSTKCWYSTFDDAQGSRLIIVIVHVGAVKIAGGAQEKERQDET